MIHCLYGKNSFASLQKLRSLVRGYQKKYPHASVTTLDSDDDRFIDSLSDCACSQDLFSSHKRIIVCSFLAQHEQIDKIKEILGYVAKASDVLLLTRENECDSSVVNAKKNEFLGCSSVCEECEPYSKTETEALCITYAQQCNCTIERLACNYLCEALSYDPWALYSEIQKLSLTNTIITKELLLSCEEYKTPELFYLVAPRCIHATMAQRLYALALLIHQNIEPAQLFNYLCSVASNEESVDILSRADQLVKKGLLDYQQALVMVATH